MPCSHTPVSVALERQSVMQAGGPAPAGVGAWAVGLVQLVFTPLGSSQRAGLEDCPAGTEGGNHCCRARLTHPLFSCASFPDTSQPSAGSHSLTTPSVCSHLHPHYLWPHVLCLCVSLKSLSSVSPSSNRLPFSCRKQEVTAVSMLRFLHEAFLL